MLNEPDSEYSFLNTDAEIQDLFKRVQTKALDALEKFKVAEKKGRYESLKNNF